MFKTRFVPVYNVGPGSLQGLSVSFLLSGCSLGTRRQVDRRVLPGTLGRTQNPTRGRPVKVSTSRRPVSFSLRQGRVVLDSESCPPGQDHKIRKGWFSESLGFAFGPSAFPVPSTIPTPCLLRVLERRSRHFILRRGREGLVRFRQEWLSRRDVSVPETGF